MIQADRNKVAAAIFKCATYYGKEMHSDQVRLFLDFLIEQFGVEADVYCQAFEQYMKDPKNKFFPAPVHLRQIIEPDVSTEDISTSLVADLVTAIRRHQYEWPVGYDNHVVGKYWFSKGNECHLSWDQAVRAELGDIGVEVIRRYTWRGLCDLYHEGNPVAFNAQLKQYITATQHILRSGNVQNLYALKEPDRKPVLSGGARNGIQVYTKPEDEGQPNPPVRNFAPPGWDK